MGAAFVLGLFYLLLVVALYWTSFGVMCAVISTRSASPVLRRTFDIVTAIVTLPVAITLFFRGSPAIGTIPFVRLMILCLGGCAFGALYAYLRRLALR